MMRLREQHGRLFILLLFCHTFCGTNKIIAARVDYVRLPLSIVDGHPDDQTSPPEPSSFSFPARVYPTRNRQVVDPGSGEKVLLGTADESRSQLPVKRSDGKNLTANLANSTIINIINLLENLTIRASDDEEEVADKEDNDSGSISSIGVNAKRKEGDDIPHKTGIQGIEEEEDEHEEQDEDSLNELDLIQLVQELEFQADLVEQTGIFPEILHILHGTHLQNEQQKQTSIQLTTTTSGERGISNITLPKTGVIPRSNDTLMMSLNEDGDLQLGSEDLSLFSDEIVDGISEGVEESLRMSGDIDMKEDVAFSDNATAQTRQFSVYLFQGQYYAEPRLNRFIDGALRNMCTEVRVAAMDPLYFRVLPRGHVAEREQPLITTGTSGVRRRRPVAGGSGTIAVGRQLPAFFRLPNIVARKEPFAPQLRAKKNKVAIGGVGVAKITNVGGANNFLRRKRQQQRLQRERRRRQRLRQQLKDRLNKQQQKNKRKKNQNNKNNTQKLLQRIRRRIRQDVGGGRIEGLSRVQRDGDAEMQLFGNYTLIRSHMKMGPVEIIMQFRTKNGIRRSGATLPVIRAHTVTRVNHEGSEMIDYLLDRPHPESIHVRGTMHPLAQKVARNIFARLFLPNSFLVSKLRDKAALAYLSKPVVARKRQMK